MRTAEKELEKESKGRAKGALLGACRKVGGFLSMVSGAVLIFSLRVRAETFTNFFNTVKGFAEEYQSQGYVCIIGLALIILGSKFLIGDDEAKARGRKSIPYIIIGTFILLSAWTLASSLGSSLQQDTF